MASELKVGICINYTSIIIRLSTAFFLTPFIINKLGVEEYGLFMLSNSIIAWLSLTDFGLGATVNKYVTTYRAKQQAHEEAHFLGQSTMLFSVLGFITLICGIFCYFSLADFFPKLNESQLSTLKVMYLLTLSNLVLAFPLRPLGCVPGAYQKFIIPGILNLSNSLLNTGLTILLLFMGYKAIGLTILSVVMSIIGLCAAIYYVFHHLKAKICFHKPDLPLFKEMFAFSFWILLNQLMDLFYWRAGTPILARTSGTLAVTIFTLGINFSQYFMTASTALSGVFSPKLMHMVALNASKKDLTYIMIRVGRMQLFLLSCILITFIALGENFLSLWVGKSIGAQVQTVWLGALIVLIPLLVPLTQNTGLAILQALNIHKGRAIILFYSSLMCVIIGYVLSLFYGSIGMFIGTAVSLFAGQNIMINIYYAKKAGLFIHEYFKQTYYPLIKSILILVPSCFIIKMYCHAQNWQTFFLLSGILGSICALTLWFLYLKKEEKQLILTPFTKLISIFSLRS